MRSLFQRAARLVAGAALACAVLATGAVPVHGQPAPAASTAPQPVPAERTVVTHHSVRLASGATLPYTATAGTLLLRDEHDEPTASVFYVAYGTGDKRRPVTFLYNGGPGSASLWLHLGSFGPRRIVTANAAFVPPPPYRLEGNPETLLDRTDLVFIDAVGTGYSRVVGKGTTREFWGVDEDIHAFTQFIQRWTQANDRTNSPKFLFGESYGTFRSAGLAATLQDAGISVSGIVLESTLLDYANVFSDSGNHDLPDALALPSETAAAWYHKKLPDPPADLQSAIDAARRFAIDEYLPALSRPTPLDGAETDRLVARLHALTGLDEAYLRRSYLRVRSDRFEAELLRREGRILGRYDARYTAPAVNRNAETPRFDPSYEAIAPAFQTAFVTYARDELQWRSESIYRALPSQVIDHWNFRRQGFAGQALAPSVIADLRHAMVANPNLRVFSANGLYDLATPFFQTEYALAHVALDADVRRRITYGYYASGHMIYLSEPALRAWRADLNVFFDAALTHAG